MTRARHALAPGVVEIRFNGDTSDVRAAVEIVGAALTAEGAQIIKQSGPYANREDPGVRAYTTVVLAPQTAGHGGPARKAVEGTGG